MNRRSFLLGTVSALAVAPLNVALPAAGFEVVVDYIEPIEFPIDTLVWSSKQRAFVSAARPLLRAWHEDGPIRDADWVRASTEHFSGNEDEIMDKYIADFPRKVRILGVDVPEFGQPTDG